MRELGVREMQSQVEALRRPLRADVTEKEAVDVAERRGGTARRRGRRGVVLALGAVDLPQAVPLAWQVAVLSLLFTAMNAALGDCSQPLAGGAA